MMSRLFKAKPVRWVITAFALVQVVIILFLANGPHKDEASFVLSGMGIVQESLLTRLFMLAPLYAAGFFAGSLEGARITTLVMTLIGLIVLSRVAERLYGTRAAFWGTLALCFNGLFNAFAHFADGGATVWLWTVLMLWLITKADRRVWTLVIALAFVTSAAVLFIRANVYDRLLYYSYAVGVPLIFALLGSVTAWRGGQSGALMLMSVISVALLVAVPEWWIVLGVAFFYPLAGVMLDRIWNSRARFVIPLMLAAMFVWGRVQWDAQEHSWHDVRPAAMYLLQNFQKGDQLVAGDSWAYVLYLYPRGLVSDANAVYGEQEAIRARLDLCGIKWFVGVSEGFHNTVMDSEVIDAAGRCGYEKVLNYPSEAFHLREASPLSIFNGVVSVYRRTIDSPPLLSWRMAAPLSIRRFDPQSAAVGDKFYLIGGLYIIQGSRYLAENSITAYDPITNLWSRVGEMPEAITHAGAAVDGIYIYIVGGLIGEHPGVTTDHVWRYDTATRQWKVLPPLPEKRAGGAAAVVNRNLHFFGGMFRDEQGVTRQDFGDHWVLNLDGEMRWVRAASMPNPRNHLAGIAYDGKVYAIGGQHLHDEYSGNQNSVHKYDPSIDQWVAVAPLPFPLSHTSASTFIACNRIVGVGGVSQNWRLVDAILEYDPLTDRWFQQRMGPAPRLAPAAGIVGDQLIVTGGLTTTDTNQTWTTTWKCP